MESKIKHNTGMKPYVFLDKFFLTSIVAVTLSMLVSGVIAFQWKVRDGDFKNPADFATSYGLLNTFFSGVALVALIRTLYLQGKALEAQQQEIAQQQVMQENLLRSERTMELYKFWNSLDMHESRRVVALKLPEWLKDGKLEIAELDKDNISDETKHLFRLIHFFVSWTLLAEAGLIDSNLLESILEPWVKDWRERLIEKMHFDGCSLSYKDTWERMQHYFTTNPTA